MPLAAEHFSPSGVLSTTGVGVGSGTRPFRHCPRSHPGGRIDTAGRFLPVPARGRFLIAPALTPAPSGYLNTMLQKIQVYIDQENIDVLSDILLRFRGLLEGDVVAPLQVQSVEQQLLTGRSTLFTDQTQYLAALDGFKLEIGVPERLTSNG